MIGKVIGGLAAGAAVCVGYGVLCEANAFRVRRVRVPVLPTGAPKIRVLHLSDIHLARGQRKKLAFVSRLAALEPDLVISTGDNIAHGDALEPLLAVLRPLLEVPGAFVFGSNDYVEARMSNPLAYLARSTSHDGVRKELTPLPTEALRAGLASGGWADVTALRATLHVRGVQLEFRGTDDAHLHRDDYSLVAGPAASGTDLSIGVTHAPYLRVLDGMAADEVPLVFAGHTHGGQVCVPGWGALTTNCDLPPAMAKGLHEYVGRDGGRSWLHVSAGIGSSPYAPYRFACPPEVTLLTLTPVPNG